MIQTFTCHLKKCLIDKYCKELKDKYNINISSDDSIHYRNSYLYGIGYFLATYFSILYLEDKKNMMKEFEKLLTKIGYTSDFDILNSLNINKTNEPYFLDKLLTKHMIDIRR